MLNDDLVNKLNQKVDGKNIINRDKTWYLRLFFDDSEETCYEAVFTLSGKQITSFTMARVKHDSSKCCANFKDCISKSIIGPYTVAYPSSIPPVCITKECIDDPKKSPVDQSGLLIIKDWLSKI